jgi:hypothetical protein
MTRLTNGTCATDLDDDAGNTTLINAGYTVRHIETWHRDGFSDSVIVWDPPALAEADIPY